MPHKSGTTFSRSPGRPTFPNACCARFRLADDRGHQIKSHNRLSDDEPASIHSTLYCRRCPIELTAAFNAKQPVVALASGQAVVYYRVAIMSKDGDWVIRETPEVCATVFQELDRRGAHYRPGAPLDVRWLSDGWSSHFEFPDDRQRRVRCARLLTPEQEIDLTTHPDRIIALAARSRAVRTRRCRVTVAHGHRAHYRRHGIVNVHTKNEIRVQKGGTRAARRPGTLETPQRRPYGGGKAPTAAAQQIRRRQHLYRATGESRTCSTLLRTK